MAAEHGRCASSWAKQSISYGTAAPRAISESAAKAVCRFIPALGLFHALRLPANPGEQDARRAWLSRLAWGGAVSRAPHQQEIPALILGSSCKGLKHVSQLGKQVEIEG